MEIIKGYDRACKTGLGGIKRVYLTEWDKKPYRAIVVDDDYLVAFPPTVLHQFESLQNPTFSETYNSSEGYYNQTISLTFPKIEGKKLRYLKNIEFRMVIEDYNGIHHIFGLYTGLELTSINYTTGSLMSDLNGVKLDFTAKEEFGSYIINNIAALGFEIDNTLI